MSDNARKATAYLNLLLVEEQSSLWPNDKEAIERVLEILRKV